MTPFDPEDVRFDNRGLVPAIVQDAGSGTLLMLAWMDREAIDATVGSGEAHFHSRERDVLWRKGETSGNTLHVVDLAIDCDGDAIRVRAHPMGPVCHTGAATCWGEDPAPPLARTLSELAALLAQRKRDLPEGSYSTELFRRGRGAIAQKVGEEGLELALAAVSEPRDRAVAELTDLVYAAMVLATDLDITADELTRSLAEKKASAATRSLAEKKASAAARRPG